MIPTINPRLSAQPEGADRQTLEKLLLRGQSRPAQVLDGGQALANGLFRVRVLLAGRLLTLDLPSPLPRGADVVLARDDAGRLQLTSPDKAPPPVVSKGMATTASPVGPLQAALDQILRTSLPRQRPVADALTRLASLSLPQTTGGRQLEQAIQSLLQLFGIRPDGRDAAAGVRRNLELGGLLTEARLAQAPETASMQDLKARMGQLLQLADRLPPDARAQMHRLIDSLLARITTRQLDSAARAQDHPDGRIERHIALDLPIQQGQQPLDNVELELSRYRGGSSDDPAEARGHWRVRLHFDLDNLGRLDAELWLDDSGTISASFLAERQETATLTERRLDDFASHLGSQGLQVERLACHQGRAARSQTGINRLLINLRT